MPENWPVKSDYNSKWVIGALAEVKRVWGFDLKMLRKFYSLGRFWNYKKVCSWRGCTPPPCIPKELNVSSRNWGKQCT